ncbi:MAG: hypothetical protein ACI9FB_001119 [Candidatus Azotimanducaceae bacterium]
MAIDSESYDWSKFEITFYYDSHITRVFKSWTQAGGLESFFVQRCVYSDSVGNIRNEQDRPQTGDQYEWQLREGRSVRGEILSVIEKQYFSFSFGEMRVEIYFRVLDTKTEVHLVQSKIPITASGQVFGHLNCRSCWVFFMTNLKSVLSKSLDLRDDDPALVSSMEVGFNRSQFS